MSLIFPLFFFALGAIGASFVGVVVARLHTGSGFVRGRSRCDACDVILAPAALVPIASFLLSGGRARCCGARLSYSAPAGELILGALFTLAYFQLGFVPALPFLLLSLALLQALVLYDLVHQMLPFSLLAPFILLSALTGFLLAPSPADYVFSLYSALFIAAFFALIHVLSRGRAMGLADAPFAFGLAALTGPVALSGLVFSFWIGAVIGIGILWRRPRGSRMGVEVPFAPYLAAGFLLAHFTQWNIFII